MHILYLTPDLTDATTTKRVRMLLAGGATVVIAGFSRNTPPATIAGCPVIDLGTTHDGKFIQRALSVISTIAQFGKYRSALIGVDLILARNMEMLAIARKARKFCNHANIAYELLDIHRLLAGSGVISTYMRWLETGMRRSASLIITSSPAFIRNYIEATTKRVYPVLLVENKVFGIAAPTAPMPRPAGPPWRIGWFGAIRCAKSFAILSEVARTNPGLVEIIIRGKPAYDIMPTFDHDVAAAPGITYLGPYQNPDDLPAIYGEVHFSWCIDMFEEGLNSAWLLPNRLYEGGLYGAVPIAACNVETSHYLSALKIGHTLAEPKAESLTTFLKSLTSTSYQHMAAAVDAVPKSTWLATQADCTALTDRLAVLVEHSTQAGERLRISAATPVLVVIPCLNEHATIVQLVKHLVDESHGLPMTIVIADGGSTDGTVELAERLAQNFPNVHHLHNRKRIQSAAVNLAVATYGNGHGYLIRIDAHAHYPNGYCATLITEANRTGADSVVVSMRTLGDGTFQQAVAAAQNSKLGNGGSAHRNNVEAGQWVDHGHHALMRIDTFRAIGGYDERFTHNEDAELDIRLTSAGRRIWLTAAVTLDYFPRDNVGALFKQYRNYGRGRARTMKKHRMIPRLRQLLPIGVLPALLLCLAYDTLGNMAFLPALAWAALCIVYGTCIALKSAQPKLLLCGIAAMIMHLAWSLGFWQELIIPTPRPA